MEARVLFTVLLAASLPLAAQSTNSFSTAAPNFPVTTGKVVEPVQIDVTSLLNARVVTTFSNGQVVPLAIALDGAGGVATAAAANALGSTNPHTVPDNGTFPADADHPQVVLHFFNADGTGMQVRRMDKPDDFSFAVPAKNYTRMQLFFTSGAAGPAPLKVTLTYQDGSTEERDIVCPDWWTNLDGKNPDCVYLASNLAKWDAKNKIMENDHHNIFGLDVHPSPEKVLTQIAVHKTRPLVCFWGATGVPR